MLLALGIRASIASSGVLVARRTSFTPRHKFARTIVDGYFAGTVPSHIARDVLFRAFDLSHNADALGVVHGTLFLRMLSAVERPAIFDLDSAGPEHWLFSESGDRISYSWAIGALGLGTMAAPSRDAEYANRRCRPSMVRAFASAIVVEHHAPTPVFF